LIFFGHSLLACASIDAALLAQLDTVQALLAAGVSGVQGDKFGLRPVQLAAQNEHWGVVKWLEEHDCAWPPPEETIE
jgi:hypothetical protein